MTIGCGCAIVHILSVSPWLECRSSKIEKCVHFSNHKPCVEDRSRDLSRRTVCGSVSALHTLADHYDHDLPATRVPRVRLNCLVVRPVAEKPFAECSLLLMAVFNPPTWAAILLTVWARRVSISSSQTKTQYVYIRGSHTRA